MNQKERKKMKKQRRKHDEAVKAKVVLELIRGKKTLSQILSEYRVIRISN
ncbi:MAG: hypothetical protein QXN68_02880 [Thermoplasmata archaeon]